MFKQSHKSARFRTRIIVSMVTLFIAIGGCVAKIHINNNVYAATEDGNTVTVHGGYNEEQHFTNFSMDIGSKTVQAYCAQSSVPGPNDGTSWEADLMDEDSLTYKKMKLLMYINQYSDSNSYAATAKEELFGNWPVRDDTPMWHVKHTHYMISAMYSDDWSWIEDENLPYLQAAISNLENYINNNADIWIIANTYNLYRIQPGEGLQDIVWIEDGDKVGSILVKKCDADTRECAPSGGASLKDIRFEVYNTSGSKIYSSKTNTLYSNNEMIASGQTNASGEITFTDLPASNVKYNVKEVGTNTWYELDAPAQDVTLSTVGETKTLNFYDTVHKGTVTVNIIDSDTGTCENSADLSFNQTVFTLINKTGNAVMYGSNKISDNGTITTSELSNGDCSISFDGLPYGQYEIEETTPAPGYIPDDNSKTVTISGPNISTDFSNTSEKGKISVSITDIKTGTCTTQGDASFENAKIKIINNSTNPVYYDGRVINNGSEIDIKTLSGTCNVTFENLPSGSYIITEPATGTGYEPNTTERRVTIPTNDSMDVSTSFENTPIVGKVTVKKIDDKTGTCTTLGDASFDGTQFQIINKSTNPIYYGNNSIDKNVVIDAKELTDGGCEISFEGLPYGSYTVKEIESNDSYNINDTEENVVLPTNNSTELVTTFANSAVLGDLTVNIIDADTGSCVNTRGLSFDGATFIVTNDSVNPIYYNGRMVNKGAEIETKVYSNDDCSIKIENLPFGTYKVDQSFATRGYTSDPDTHVALIPVAETGDLHATVQLVNEPIRGDVRFVKKDPTNNKVMRDVLFSISAIDDDYNIIETHIVVSNNDGLVDTSATFAEHTNNTNGYDELYDEIDPFSFSGFGSWFGGDENGNPLPARNEVGALPYGKYIIQELRCASNLFCNGIANEKTTIIIDEANEVIDLGDWDNACIKLSVQSEAVDKKDDDKYIEAGDDTAIRDIIRYCVKPNVEFRIHGVVIDKETGEPYLVDGNIVEQDYILKSDVDCGEVEMDFDIDTSELAGKELAVTQTLYYQDDVITSHDDLDDEALVVQIIDMSTYATNNDTDEKPLPIDESVVIKDTVEYCLKAGKEYTIKGVLMDKATNTELLVNDRIISAEKTFIPQESCGEIEMTYEVDTTELAGKDIVVFESIYDDEGLVIERTSINSADATVTVDTPETQPEPEPEQQSEPEPESQPDSDSTPVNVPNTGMFSDLRTGLVSTSQIVVIVGIIVGICVGEYKMYKHKSNK